MKFLISVFGMVLLLGMSMGITNVFAEQIIEANPTSLTYSIYQNPAISGTITDENGEPIPGIYVYSYFSSEKKADWSDENGKFFLRSSEKYPSGEHLVEVYARSGGSLSRTVVSFEVQEPEIPKSDPTYPVSQIKNGLSIEEMMNDVKSQNQKVEQAVQSQDKKSSNIDKQRQLAEESLEYDLKENSHEVQQEENKNAFASFVGTLDSLMHAIFWDQFDFTQKVSNEAYEAKTSALDEGKTSLEATKVYQDTAAVSQKEVVDYIKEINIKHGFANATVQKQFDENGKYNGTLFTDQEDLD